MPDARHVSTDLGAGALCFQSSLWQTNSLLVVIDGKALLCDPAYTPDDIEAIRDAVRTRGAEATHVLITHADFDHTCGIAHFPDAEIVAGADTAAKIKGGEAVEGLRSQGPEWGLRWRDELRVDRVVHPPERVELGPFRVDAVAAPSHGREGTAFVLQEQGILCPGDHLSAITYPLLGGPLTRKVDATRQLLETLERYELRWVVPGHGPPLEPAEAARIGEQDLAYLELLEASAREARRSRLAPGYALLHVYAVEPPRPTTHDFEIYDVRASNGRLALAEV